MPRCVAPAAREDVMEVLVYLVPMALALGLLGSTAFCGRSRPANATISTAQFGGPFPTMTRPTAQHHYECLRKQLISHPPHHTQLIRIDVREDSGAAAEHDDIDGDGHAHHRRKCPPSAARPSVATWWRGWREREAHAGDLCACGQEVEQIRPGYRNFRHRAACAGASGTRRQQPAPPASRRP